MHSVLLVVLLSLLGIYVLQTLLELRRAIHSVGYVLLVRPRNDITERYLGRHLPGPRLLFDPIWFLGQLIRRALPPVRYVSREVSWPISEGYQGGGMSPMQVIVMRVTASCRFRHCRKGRHCSGEFPVLYMRREGRELRTMDWKISVLPKSKTVIFLADAAAIKVRDTSCQTGCIDLYFVFAGGDNFSCQVSQTRLPILGAVGFWKQRRSFRRGGMEKVPNDRRSGLLRGM